jgi:cytochrome oxidase Cu insertion factor (SCO1/SenC/PrrC family)
MHSTRLVLVDARGRIRGYYSSEEEGVLGRLAADVRRLVQQ